MWGRLIAAGAVWFTAGVTIGAWANGFMPWQFAALVLLIGAGALYQMGVRP